MKRFLLAAFLMIALPVLGDPSFISSSVALEDITGRNFCSGAVINASKRYVLTAAHCTPGDAIVFVDGLAGTVVAKNEGLDMAIIAVPGLRKPDLKLASKAPEVGDEVQMAGHPLGVESVFYSRGWVSALKWTFSVEDPNGDGWMIDYNYTIFQIVGAPGSSGTVVVNSKGEAISVIQVGWVPGFHMGGAPFDALKRFAGPYFRTR
jgi:S1-C subfamily serine protease